MRGDKHSGTCLALSRSLQGTLPGQPDRCTRAPGQVLSGCTRLPRLRPLAETAVRSGARSETRTGWHSFRVLLELQRLHINVRALLCGSST